MIPGLVDVLAVAAEVPLPGRLAGPLHFPSPPSCLWLVIWALMLVGLLGWLLRLAWRRLRRRQPVPRERPRPAPVRRRTTTGITAAIAAILERNLRRRSYRRGCHELSETLRAHWEEQGLGGHAGQRLTRMTAREIRGRVGERPATRLLALLSELQFGRRRPSRKEFRGACELAAELVTKRGGG